ncbi:MAG: hypothetical protein KGN80_08280 [Acidobacteriota bacterium]|nr:hypothetical protein [Acidobacteriota bacterium]
MDRFGSSRLRIVWACVFLLLTGLVLAGIRSDGTNLQVFGGVLPKGDETINTYATSNLGVLIYWVVPFVILMGGFLGLAGALGAPTFGERIKGLFVATGLAFLHGLFLSQIALLPFWAAAWKLLGTPFPAALLQADLLGLLLGLQLLLWSAILMRIIQSNAGLAVLLAFLLKEIGSRLVLVVDFGEQMGFSAAGVKAVGAIVHVLPSGQLPSDPFAPSALPLSLGGPLLLAALLCALPARKGKKT